MAAENKHIFKKIMSVVGVTIFFLSYLPFVLLIEYGFHGTQAGLFGGPYIYGFEAMANCFVWLCFIPVYPVCIIYQLIFGILYIRKHKILKLITIAVVVSIITAILIAGVTFEFKKAKKLSIAREEITEYLADKYGEGVTEGITIRIEDYDDDSYNVTSPVLPDHYGFFNVSGSDGSYSDTLTNGFTYANTDYLPALEAYLDDLYDLPDNYDIQVFVDNIYFGDYRDGDDYESLFDVSDYNVQGIEVRVDSIDDEEVLSLINNVYVNEYPKFEDNVADYYTIYIKVNDQNAFSVVNNPDSGIANISIYSNYNGYTTLDNQAVELAK